MTFEERLDRIAEKHEALAQTVEIIAGMHRENERVQAELQAENERRFAETDKRIGRVVDLVTNLTNIVESHERRLDRLES